MKNFKNFKNFVFAIILALGCVCTTGCGVDDATSAAHSAKEQVTTTAHNAKETVDWWTRSTDHQSWTNPSGTKIEIEERRKEGDFKVTITYMKDNLNSDDNRENVKPTGDITMTVYVDSISEEFMEELQSY